jgi:trimeric autotransporter adhesin
LYANTIGNKNTASGALALVANTTGSYNTASGYQTLTANTDGIRNTATGDWALYSNTHGNDNTADGHDALHSNTVGSNNIGLGANAGFNVTSGSNNIEIGNQGTSSDHGIIRVGTSGSQSATYIAGISTAHVIGAAVYVTSSGQLGVLASSERYKTEIASMGASTEKLQALRPVSFHLKTDPNGAVQYGLSAEEVDKVYPELVIRDAAGRIQGVRYDELGAMLLNEVQKQQLINESQGSEIRDLKKLVIEMQAGLLKLQAKDARLAQR